MLTPDQVDALQARCDRQTAKGVRCDQLPLPGDVAQAIAAYLLDVRYDFVVREVFLALIAVYRKLTILVIV